MMSQLKFNSITNKNLVEDLNSSPTMIEFIESVSLVISNISSLFGRKIYKIPKRIVKVQTSEQNQKKKFYSLSNNLNGESMLQELEKFKLCQNRNIKIEFFYTIAKKFAKTQSLEKYVQFFAKLIEIYGLDPLLVKFFVTGDRDYTEIGYFLESLEQILKKQNQTQENIDQILNDCLISILEKLAQQTNFEDFFFLLEKKQNLFNENKNNENFTKMFISLINSVIQKHSSHLLFTKCLSIFSQKNFIFTTDICNNILTILLKQNKQEEFFEFFINFMQDKEVEYNLDTYKSLMSYYNKENKFQESLNIYEVMIQKKLCLDEEVYFLLITGPKEQTEETLQKSLEFFEEYKNSIENQSIQIYNAMIEILILNNKFEKATELFESLESNEKLKPDQFTFNVLIKNSCKQKNLDFGLKYLKLMQEDGMKPNKITYNLLMDLAVKIERMNEALRLIEQMNKNEIYPDSFTYSIILNGLKINNSSIQLVKLCLKNIEKVLKSENFRQDQILYNSLFELAFKHDLLDSIENFHNILLESNIQEGEITCNILIKAYSKSDKFDKAYSVFNKMIDRRMNISDVSYGYMLDACSKFKRMDLAMKIYNSLNENEFYINSIVYTTILKGFQKSRQYQQAIVFFNSIKDRVDLPGMIITYNCVLNIYCAMENYEEAEKLFQEIEKYFKADLISYSTIIRGLTKNNQIQVAQAYVKKMIKSKIKIDISVVNLFLESCSNKDDFKFGLNTYQFAMMQNIVPNEITFGIMVKLYGFSRELSKAFELLDLMAVYEIHPSIIIFTNLIHISFYNKKPRKAELAYQLLKKKKLRGDCLLYSKIIDGLIRFKEFNKIEKYIDYALKERVSLKPKTQKSIRKFMGDDQNIEQKLKQLEKNKFVKHAPHKHVHKNDNNFSKENPKKYKQIIRDQRKFPQHNENNQDHGNNNYNSQKKWNKKNNWGPKKYYKKDPNYQKPQTSVFNFRRKKVSEEQIQQLIKFIQNFFQLIFVLSVSKLSYVINILNSSKFKNYFRITVYKLYSSSNSLNIFILKFIPTKVK